jgi:hypothetical protein
VTTFFDLRFFVSGSNDEILLNVNSAHDGMCLFTGLPNLCNEGEC